MPGHMKKAAKKGAKAGGMGKAKPKAKRAAKKGAKAGGLTAKQKTLPAFLQKKIRQAKRG